MLQTPELESLYSAVHRLSSSQRVALLAHLKEHILQQTPVNQDTIQPNQDDDLRVAALGVAGSLGAMRRRQLAGAKERLSELAFSNQALEAISLTDALTGLVNRRSFDHSITAACVSCAAQGKPLALAMIDVDHFKSFNDRLGHPAGDVCLQKVAQALRSVAAGPNTTVARYGGEEFAVIMVGTDHESAVDLSSLMRAVVEQQKLPFPEASWTTVSIGLASVQRVDERTATELLAAADRLLYEAKRGGRNRVEHQLFTHLKEIIRP